MSVLEFLIGACFGIGLIWAKWYDNSHGTNNFRIVWIAFWVYFVINIVLYVFARRWIFIKEKIISHLTFGICMIVATVIPVIVHFVCFSKQNITESDWLGFYGDYIAFLGTVFLGYIVYRKDENIRKRENINKAKLLYSILNGVLEQMDLLEKNPDRVSIISYSETWREYYYEIADLVQKDEHYLRIELEKIFGWVDAINVDLRNGNKKEAIARYRKFIKMEQYSFHEFNFIEARSKIYEIAYLNYVFTKPRLVWYEEKEIKTKIEKYVVEFFSLIELKVYNCLIKTKEKELESDVIEYEIVDWLMTNPELKELVKTPYDKRIIARIFFLACLDMKKKSDRVDFVWGTFSLKK